MMLSNKYFNCLIHQYKDNSCGYTQNINQGGLEENYYCRSIQHWRRNESSLAGKKVSLRNLTIGSLYCLYLFKEWPFSTFLQ